MSDPAGTSPTSEEGEEAADDASQETERSRRRRDALAARGKALGERATERVDAVRDRSHLVDVGFRVYDRDRDAGGTLLGSALSLRLFLFFVPLVLFTVGLAGLIGRHAAYSSFSSDAGISGSIGNQIDTAFSQSSSAAWFACAAGLVGIATTGYSLSKALIVSSALSWQLGGRQRAAVRAVGVLVGLIVGIGLITVIINRIRDATGVAVASLSFFAVFFVYVLLWLLVFQTLPRATTDPGASLPGSVLTSRTLTGSRRSACCTCRAPSSDRRSCTGRSGSRSPPSGGSTSSDASSRSRSRSTR